MTNFEARTILELDRKYTVEDMKSHYRQKCKQYHPDLNKNKEYAEAMMKQINEAYEVLTTAIKDENLKNELNQYKEEIFDKIYHQQKENQQKENQIGNLVHEYNMYYRNFRLREDFLYNSVIDNVQFSRTKAEIDESIEKFNNSRQELISEFADKLFSLWRKNHFLLGFSNELKSLYNSEKLKVISLKTINEVYLYFETTKNIINEKAKKITVQINESIKRRIYDAAVKYENYAYYDFLKDSIETVKKEKLTKCLEIRNSLKYYSNPNESEKTINIIIDSVERSCDDLFNKFQEFLKEKNNQIIYIIDLGKDYINDKNSIIIKLINKYVEMLGNIYEQDAFTKKYIEAVNVISRNIHEYEEYRRKENLEIDIVTIQQKLNERFKKIKMVSAKYAEILYLSLNAIKGIREGLISTSKLACLLGITFDNYEKDMEIIQTIYDEEVSLKIIKKQSDEKIIDFKKQKTYTKYKEINKNR